MPRHIALKKLKSSDLSFFKSYLKRNPDAKQKGFNLDTSVMEGVFFPSLKAQLAPLPKQAAHVDLTLFGPGLTEAHTLARKVKRDAKNIRLNGEVVDNPISQPARYDILAPGDFALMEFSGVPLPSAVKVVLISATHQDDGAIHAALLSLLPAERASMKVLAEDDLERLIASTNPSPQHPIRDWLDAELLEEIGHGDGNAAERLNRRRPGRGISLSDLKASKEAAARTGLLGEELLDLFLTSPGLPWVTSHEWVAQTNAISPFDFLLAAEAGLRHADAKSTSGKFANPIYLSIAELIHAVDDDAPYDIFRLYQVTEESARLRIARDIGSRLRPVLDALKNVPHGASVDSLSFEPSFFDFEDEEYLIETPVDENEVGE